MSLIETTEPDQREFLSFEFDLHHRPEKVWRALTDPDLLSQWLLPTIGFRLEPGAEFKLKTEPKPGWDGTVNCRFVEIEAGRKLCWNWVVGDIDTVVTFTLTPTDGGTRMSLVHSGFKPDQKHNVAGARYGWNMMGGKLVDLLETTP
jgi:uncharacterized protein YndB with AHSA1/START domain